ncbi:MULTISPECIES: hypothetical protein [unclassified Sedimentibacter]|uniref:hypothetical protein n=1 Tax=unclassified Sedimentibacter TaxID=2649220 RepID=UPI0027DFF18F|nr:hypothetical protein [Sedimentibacter sp. MB35-C1]WMJ78520.1 hypothetical protein RBQ61_06250 [Sedimentibacter sp. MB35-C1]
MKKIGIFLLIAVLLMVTGCSKGETAEQATVNALDAVKTLDKETLGKYMNYNELVESDDGSESEYINKIFENLDYKIISSEEKENEAVVKADITNIDMEKVMGEAMKNSLAEVFSQAFSNLGEQQSEAESEDMFNEHFEQAIENNKDSKVVNTVDIKLTKVDEQWKINMDSDLQNALMGNLYRVANQLKDIFE